MQRNFYSKNWKICSFLNEIEWKMNWIEISWNRNTATSSNIKLVELSVILREHIWIGSIEKLKIEQQKSHHFKRNRWNGSAFTQCYQILDLVKHFNTCFVNSSRWQTLSLYVKYIWKTLTVHNMRKFRADLPLNFSLSLVSDISHYFSKQFRTFSTKLLDTFFLFF